VCEHAIGNGRGDDILPAGSGPLKVLCPIIAPRTMKLISRERRKRRKKGQQ